MLNVFEFVIILVIAVLAFRLWETKIKHKPDVSEEEPPEDLKAQLDDLQSRIEVLERIVTDSKYDLNRELNNLEDDARNSA